MEREKRKSIRRTGSTTAGGTARSSNDSFSDPHIKDFLEDHEAYDENALLEKVSNYWMEQWLPISNFGKDLLVDDSFIFGTEPESEVPGSVKLDIALYTLLLKNLCEHVSTEEGQRLDTLRQLPQLFSQISSVHSQLLSAKVRGTERMSENEATTLAYAVTASSTAEALAQKKGINADVGFMFGLMRQLGLLLIAFNYPTVLKEAIEFSKSGVCTLPEALGNMLGVTPAELGYRVLTEWQIGEEVKAALTSEEALPTNDEMRILFQCSRTGERLAQTSLTPDSAVSQAERASILTELEAELGQQGFFDLTSSMNDRLFTYVQDKPHCFNAAPAFSISPEEFGGKLYYANKDLQECPEVVKMTFLTAYKSAEEGAASPFALASLTSSVIPKIGFLRGCLYIVDRERGLLTPKLPLGSASVDSYSVITPQASSGEFLGISSALRSDRPIIERNIIMYGRRLSHISGRLRPSAKGVLFLEMNKNLRDLPAKNVFLLFGAIRQALIDFLNLPD